MGRAIVRDPQVFLFDEPLSNLDAKLRVQMRTEIKELHQRLKTTAIYVTHDQIEAMTMADRIVVMQHGVVEQLGAPLELYDRPVNLFVAGFIGSPAMNFIEAKVASNNGRPVAVAANGTALPLPTGAPLRNDADIVYGIRPEHLHLREAGAGLEAEVVVVEPTGAKHCWSRESPGSSARPCSASGISWSPALRSASSRSSTRSISSTGRAGDASSISWRSTSLIRFPTEEINCRILLM